MRHRGSSAAAAAARGLLAAAAEIWCGAARSAAAKFLAYGAKSRPENFLRMLKAKSTSSNPYVAKALKARAPSLSPTIPARRDFPTWLSWSCIGSWAVYTL